MKKQKHAEHLEEATGVGPHTISMPRLRAADGVDIKQFPSLITDEELLAVGTETIEKNLMDIPDEIVRKETIEKLSRIEKGERDLRF